jgi:hypothetical protein
MHNSRKSTLRFVLNARILHSRYGNTLGWCLNPLSTRVGLGLGEFEEQSDGPNLTLCCLLWPDSLCFLDVEWKSK